MFSIAPGSWFLSSLFVLGSSEPLSDKVSLHFQRKQFKELQIRIQNSSQEVILIRTLDEDIKEFTVSMAGWPKGIYRLFLEDKEKNHNYLLKNY